MQTLTKEKSRIIIPDKIQEKINERWFYLYSFITPKEVKSSIERDYLKILSTIALPLWAVSIVLWIIMFPLFLATIWITFTVIILYLIIISIKRSITLNHISNVVLTDKAISIWWKIIKNEEFDKQKHQIEKYEKEFDEKLFEESKLWNVGFSLLNEVINKVWKLFWWIIEHSDNAKATVFLVLLAIVYVWIISWVYFIWIFIIWIFGLFIMLINKAILKVTWHKIFYINDLFNKIDYSSNILVESKNILSLSLLNALENKWQDWLLNDINKWIKQVNYEANISIQNIFKLRKTLEKSEYKDIFNFEIYNNWIKKQIIEPLEEIKNLLKKNIEIINKTIEELKNQINNTEQVSLKTPMELQKIRLEKQKEEFLKYSDLINNYIEKLK